MKIATLEIDQGESRILQGMLVAEGHECIAFFTGQSLIDALHYKRFDLLILEWVLRDMTGSEVIKRIREGDSKNMKVMLLTEDDSEAGLVNGLKAGANDCLIKPICASRLNVRMQALSSMALQTTFEKEQTTKRMPDFLGVGFYRFDLAQGIVSIRDQPIDLQPKEFDIAALLFSHIGQVVSREKIMNEIWGRTLLMTSRTLDTHMSRVRTKLQLNSDNKVRLVTVYTIGYRLDLI